MSVEMRRLVFSRDEVISAAFEFCRMQRIAVPDTALDGIEITPGYAPSLTLCFRARSPMDPDRVTLSNRQLTTAMEEYCRRQEIPISRHPEKGLRVVDGDLTMFYRIEHAGQCSFAA